MNTQRELITDSADLHDLALETLSTSSMAAMGDLLDRVEAKLHRWRAATAAMSAMAQA